MTCEVYLSTHPRRLQWFAIVYTKPNITKKSLKNIMSPTNSSQTSPTRNRMRKSAISYIVLEKLVLQPVRQTHGEDGF